MTAEPAGVGAPAQPESAAVRIAIDAMGGDAGPEAVVAAARAFVSEDALRARFLVFGDSAALTTLLATAPDLKECCEAREADAVVGMADGPREALRRGRSSSMSRALDAVAQGEADVAVSAGNTAALMAMSVLRVRPADASARPAIAALWPAVSAAGAAVVLDVGANISADADAIVDNAVMGAAYAAAALGVEVPRVAVLNVGAEPSKGRADLRAAAQRLQRLDEAGALGGRFVGFVEGDAIAFDVADVVVTDGFTGNVALKSAEGAARLVGRYMREAFGESPRGALGAMVAAPALRRLKERMDPRSVNGGAFLGLRRMVVKSHGAADEVAWRSALDLAARVAAADLPTRIADHLAQARAAAAVGGVTMGAL